jgi:hypothetical protein
MSSAPELKATLTLPQTAFPMKANLPQNEPLRLARWASLGCMRAAQGWRGRPAYLLHDGPPYANGPIHLGHALNKGLKDFVVKSKTMAGFDAPYVPGFDCHGLPIEIKVDEQLGRKKLEMPVPPCWMPAAPTRRSMSTCKPSSLSASAASAAGRSPTKPCRAPTRRDAGGVLRLSREGLRLPRPEAGLLVHPRPHGAGRGRGGVRDAHQPVGLCALPADLRSGGDRSGAGGPRGLHHHLDDDAVDAAGVAGRGVSSGLRVRGARETPTARCTSWPQRWQRRSKRPASWLERHDRACALQGRGARPRQTFQHPFLDRSILGVLATYVTADTGTGAVHTAPSHGADDFYTGQRYGLDPTCRVDAGGHIHVDPDAWPLAAAAAVRRQEGVGREPHHRGHA